MGLGQSADPSDGDLAAINFRSEKSLLAADENDPGKTIRLRATATGALKTDTTVVTESLQELVDLLKGFAGTPIQEYGTASAVAVATPTTVATYTVPALKVAFINQVSGSGENVSVYKAQVNGADISVYRSNATNLNADMNFNQNGSGLGLKLVAGDVFRVQVDQIGPGTADFEVFIGGIEFDA